MSMDIKQYNQLKADGLINKVQKTNTDTPDALTYAVYIKQYELKGAVVKQLPDEVQAITEVELKKLETDADEVKASVTAFRADAVNGVV